MPKFTDSQLVILSAAARREDGAVLPLPKSLKLQGGAATRVLKSLIKKGLLAEKPAARDAAAWRTGEDGRRRTLVITEAGLQAIGVDADEKTSKRAAAIKRSSEKRGRRAERKPTAAKAKPRKPPPAVRQGTKQALLIDLLKRKRGATIAEARDTTGWQSHSLRAAITGLRKQGFLIERSKNGGVSHYRIVAQRKAA